MNKRELYSYTGNSDQLYGVRRLTLEEGSGKGITIYDVTTAGGLQFDVTADNGLDIGKLRYKGTNISYLSKNGYTSPYRFDPFENDFVHTFPGGMLYILAVFVPSDLPTGMETSGIRFTVDIIVFLRWNNMPVLMMITSLSVG